MYHSLIFEKIVNGKTRTCDTWEQWNLIPSSRPVFAQPTVQYKYVDIPGRHGQLDLTDYMLGDSPVYSDRKGQFDFYVSNNYVDAYARNWTSRRAEIAEFFDGSKMKCTLEDDHESYFYGRFMLKEWRSEATISHVIIEYQVDPFRYKGSVSNMIKVGL